MDHPGSPEGFKFSHSVCNDCCYFLHVSWLALPYFYHEVTVGRDLSCLSYDLFGCYCDLEQIQGFLIQKCNSWVRIKGCGEKCRKDVK